MYWNSSTLFKKRKSFLVSRRASEWTHEYRKESSRWEFCISCGVDSKQQEDGRHTGGLCKAYLFPLSYLETTGFSKPASDGFDSQHYDYKWLVEIRRKIFIRNSRIAKSNESNIMNNCQCRCPSLSLFGWLFLKAERSPPSLFLVLARGLPSPPSGFNSRIAVIQWSSPVLQVPSAHLLTEWVLTWVLTILPF